jgi:hypothetical protein
MISTSQLPTNCPNSCSFAASSGCGPLERRASIIAELLFIVLLNQLHWPHQLRPGDQTILAAIMHRHDVTIRVLK